MLKDYYAILGVAEGAPVAEIKQQYQRLLLIHHPDKQQQQQNQFLQASAGVSSSTVTLQEIKEAWENLRLPEQRAFYDSSLKAMRLRANGQVNEDIDLDDMEFDEGNGEFVISVKELELGVDTVTCSTCSLIVRIHYEAADDSEED
ncbi:Diphthamide biosynthesis protein 4 [Mortierella sp. NVP85]|nr:Diphthamide biosynthesis protein 4 [Mortierella sp. NVP85]